MLAETGDAAVGDATGIEGTGGIEPDGLGAFIRLGILGANDGWSITQLLAEAQARFVAELARTGATEIEAIFGRLIHVAGVRA